VNVTGIKSTSRIKNIQFNIKASVSVEHIPVRESHIWGRLQVDFYIKAVSAADWFKCDLPLLERKQTLKR